VPSMPMNEEQALHGRVFENRLRQSLLPAGHFPGKETDCTASETPWMTPVSCMGKKPLGMRMNMTMVATRVAARGQQRDGTKAQHHLQDAAICFR